MHSSVMPLTLMTPSRKYQNFSKRNLQNRHYFRQHCIAKMPATEYTSAFAILFNFSTAAERQEFYFRHFGNALTLYVTLFKPVCQFKIESFHVALLCYFQHIREACKP